MLVAVVLAGGALLPNKQTNAQMHENNMLQLSVQRQRHSFAQWREWHRTMAIHSSMSNGTVAHSPLVSSPTTSLPICISRTRCTSPSRSSGSRCSCAAACICVSGEVFCVCSYLSCIYLRARAHADTFDCVVRVRTIGHGATAVYLLGLTLLLRGCVCALLTCARRQ